MGSLVGPLVKVFTLGAGYIKHRWCGIESFQDATQTAMGPLDDLSVVRRILTSHQWRANYEEHTREQRRMRVSPTKHIKLRNSPGEDEPPIVRASSVCQHSNPSVDCATIST